MGNFIPVGGKMHVIVGDTLADAKEIMTERGQNVEEVLKGLSQANKADSEFSETSSNSVANSIVTERFNTLEDSINSLLAAKASLSMNATPSLIFVGETKDVTVAARVNGGNAESITLGKDGGPTQTVKNQNSATMLDNITGIAGTIASYTAAATVYGKVLTATTKVEGVHPVYFGSAFNWDEVVNPDNKQTARKAPNGVYTAVIEAGARAVFAIPESMTFDPAKLKDKIEGFGFPVSLVTNDGGYKYYESGVFKKLSAITLIYQ